MNAEEVQELLETMLRHADWDEYPEAKDIASIRTFEEGGLLTMDKGLLLDMEDGSQFQITIVQSAYKR
jgi:hypothetical protein